MFEVGDKVASITFGNGVITSIDNHMEYPIKVKFKDCTKEVSFTEYGLYHKHNKYEQPNNIKKADTTSEATNIKKTRVTGFGHLIEFDNGIYIYHPNQGQPFQVYPKHNAEGLS